MCSNKPDKYYNNIFHDIINFVKFKTVSKSDKIHIQNNEQAVNDKLNLVNLCREDIKKYENLLSEVRAETATIFKNDMYNMIDYISAELISEQYLLRDPNNKPIDELYPHGSLINNHANYYAPDKRFKNVLIDRSQLNNIYLEESNKACENIAHFLIKLGFTNVKSGSAIDEYGYRDIDSYNFKHGCKISLNKNK